MSRRTNRQNIPARSAEGLEIRSAFEADEGKLIISADYSQIELRLLAHLSGDPVLVESFNWVRTCIPGPHRRSSGCRWKLSAGR